VIGLYSHANQEVHVKEFDFGADAPRVDTSRLGELSELITEMQAREERVLQIEEELKTAKAELAEVQEQRGPELMDELRTKDFTTAGGLRVQVKEELKHSLGNDPANKARALQIMRQLKQGGSIRNVVMVEFSLQEDAKADELVTELRARGLLVSRDEMIHSSTLKSILKQLLKRGVQIPELKETFGAYWRRQLKVTRKG